MIFFVWKEKSGVFWIKTLLSFNKNRKETEKRIQKSIDDKFESLFSDLREEENIKNGSVSQLTAEFEVGITSSFTKLKDTDCENEKKRRIFSDNLKKDSTLIFETIKKVNQAIEGNQNKVNSLNKEIVEKSTVY